MKYAPSDTMLVVFSVLWYGGWGVVLLWHVIFGKDKNRPSDVDDFV